MENPILETVHEMRPAQKQLFPSTPLARSAPAADNCSEHICQDGMVIKHVSDGSERNRSAGRAKIRELRRALKQRLTAAGSKR
jgi:hypothetical protein